jgi:predicted DNA-binding protein (MmcQ/YjbR family)
VSARSIDPAARVREICLALPGASEKLSHGEPAFFVRGRMFAMCASASNHHGGGRHAVWVKAPPGAQETMVEAEGARFFVPPYVGVSGWMGIWLDRGVDWPSVAAIIEDGYRILASKKQLAELAASS